LSILVHPDKNPDNKEKAQQAFDGTKSPNLFFLFYLSLVLIAAIRQAMDYLKDEEKLAMLGERFEEAQALSDEIVRLFSINIFNSYFFLLHCRSHV
jgi:hypothetical protein